MGTLGKVDIVFNGHVHNDQRSFPPRFEPVKQGALMVDGKTRTVRQVDVDGKELGRFVITK